MKEILQKLFSPATPATVTAAVIRRLSPGRYELADDSGRIIQADATLTLVPGQRAIIQSGRVIALSGRQQSIRTYEV
jgi:hypothetical protein